MSLLQRHIKYKKYTFQCISGKMYYVFEWIHIVGIMHAYSFNATIHTFYQFYIMTSTMSIWFSLSKQRERERKIQNICVCELASIIAEM